MGYVPILRLAETVSGKQEKNKRSKNHENWL